MIHNICEYFYRPPSQISDKQHQTPIYTLPAAGLSISRNGYIYTHITEKLRPGSVHCNQPLLELRIDVDIHHATAVNSYGKSH